MSKLSQAVYDQLNELGINYDVVEHPAVYTIEEMDKLNINHHNEIVKNLFLRDDKKKRYILVVISKEKQLNLKELKTRINSRPLSFASEDSLYECLGLSKGSVTPFGVLNDEQRCVEILFDKSILSYKIIGVHPNDNTATVFLHPSDLVSVIEKHGNKVEYVEI